MGGRGKASLDGRTSERGGRRNGSDPLVEIEIERAVWSLADWKRATKLVATEVAAALKNKKKK